MNSKCPNCKNNDYSNSPTGAWCNNCGWQSPCECARGDHQGCKSSINKVRAKSGYAPLVESCCCGIQALDLS